VALAGKAEALVEVQWLEGHLHDPRVRLVEVDVGSKAYDEGHVEGAGLWNVYQDLKDADYLLIDRAATERLVGRSGIAPDSVVVFYGYAPSLAFWLMKLYGHADVRILNCSRNAWRDEGRPWSADPVVPTATDYRLPDPDARTPSTAARGSGPRVEWRRGAVPVMFPRRCMCPSMACTTTEDRFGRQRNFAGSFRRSTCPVTMR
jgi:thiosulfate/3-mercaptopyruvate sulfurtransferase